ncbi:MarR family winged helix-turn-helix transcriptional regulator [Corynebacterium flavescens]|uniref:MarR family winged helix-turn-helix transcriptional regulator n=1 Tax=Corynebacterium flavescens TaxID=28028 RepID=UPI002648E235|nr:MarR family transcriptional regulator [Corynebacterium flavescens]MDN6099652.1 MarR family transcriptional regulator [Corynebacterium flavescens]MDN6235386.1 MarR family transcriptional regulator [Corynebacterium flavescens]MDN6431595.1 MarR family transcriptional regulator [Corynebacterium flavescens]MDN6476088.1 MarR family transcriptional regulator [Corynebacterium flavescens]MDN6532210.1 MarR family transcriptional regulator [Corynebacterium flavescens]
MSVTDKMVCFSLYSAARATMRAYRTLLEPWELTYPQYLVMVVLWNDGQQNMQSLGEAMQLDSGTLSPLLRRLEKAGYLARERRDSDARIVTVTLTDAGTALESELAHIPTQVRELMLTTDDEQARQLLSTLQEMCASLNQSGAEKPDKA